MEPSSQTIRIERPLNPMGLNANSQNDYRKLPRSSGDGMESQDSSTDSDGKIVNDVQIHGSMSKEASAVPRDTLKTFTSNLPVSVPAKTLIAALPNEIESKKQDLPLKSCQQPGSPSNQPVTELGDDLGEDNRLLSFENNTILQKSHCLERKAECLDLHSLIKDLEERNQTLTSETEKLVNKLYVQSKVNADLKKLLVASVGEDIGARLEEMVINKAQFDTTLENLKTQLDEVTEELSRVSIECDVWRTKFLASRVMTSGLTDIKTTLFMQHRNCQAALQKLLEEQSDIRQHLRATNRLLQGVYKTVDLSDQTKKNCWEETFQKSSIIELAYVNYNLAEDICYSVNPSHLYATANKNSSPEEEIIPVSNLTPAEQMACEALKTDAVGATNADLMMQKMGREYIGNSYASRFLTNNFRVTFDCCDRCAGPLRVV